ncbi:cyclin-dependent kinase 20 [Culicoides brevitarsis]|uniref:cyclin-dependent kinase 20 n=1 Tax=Culicoides brevitarsis TaxID=469753 RepID=UPI00307C1D0A
MENYAPSKYKILSQIGEGVHGIVLKAKNKETNQLVAIKKLILKNKFGGVQLSTLREIMSLKKCDCKYILKLIEIFYDISGPSLVLEYMPYTLHSKLRDHYNPLCRHDIKKYTHMLLKGLNYLHENNIMHRDIKPSNLLIDSHGILKLGDFGLSRVYFSELENRPYTAQVASRYYRAPEILYGSQRYSPMVDIWAVGCVFAEMLRGGTPLFAGSTDIEQLALVIRSLGTPSLRNWPEIQKLPDYHKISFPYSKGEPWENMFPTPTMREEIELVDALIQYNPKKRLTANEAISHHYFT